MGTPETPAEERIAEYLAKAEAARRAALTCRDLHSRKSFEKLADGWQQLAEQIARTKTPH